MSSRLTRLLWCCGLIASGAWAQVTFVQAAEGSFSGPQAQSPTVTFPSPATAGSVVLVSVFSLPGDVIKSVTDSEGRSYLRERTIPGLGGFTGYTLELFWTAVGVSGTAPLTITVAGTVQTYLEVVQLEYAGTTLGAPFGEIVVAASGSPPIDSGVLTTRTPGEVLVLSVACEGVLPAAPPGFIPRSNINGDLVAELTTTSPGPYLATGTGTCNAWQLVLLSLVGPVDAGVPDAGVGAGGGPGPGFYPVACGCAPGGGGLALPLIAVALVLRRARRKTRPPVQEHFR